MSNALPYHSHESGNLYKQKNLDSCMRRNDNPNYKLISLSTIRNENRLDAEYFQQKFLKLQRNLESGKYKYLHKLCEFIRVGPAGSALPASKYVTFGIKVYRPSNLNGWNCDNGGFVYISEKYHNDQHLYLYKKADLLITRVGDIKFGIIDEDNIRATISPNIIVLRTKRKLLDPYFLLAFLNTEFGLSQIKRGKKISSLPYFGIKQITDMLIPYAPIENQIKISRLVRNGFKKMQLAKSLYSQAEEILMHTIGLNNTSNTAFSTISLTEIRHAHRLDPQHFLSIKSKVRKSIKIIKIKEIAKIFRGINPGGIEYKNKGKLFLRVSNLTKYGLIDKSQKYISPQLFKKLHKKYEPQFNEILLVKDGKPGVAYHLSKSFTGIISEGIVRLKLKTSIPPEYVSLCINSPFCKIQIKTHTDGSLVPHWKIEQIEKLKIPLVSPDKIKNLTNLINKYIILFHEGKNLLGKAVQDTEELLK